MKLLIIGFVWPEPKSSAAGSRMMQLINAFKCNGYSITFASTAIKNEHSVDLESLGVRTSQIELNSDSFNVFIKRLQPDLVIFDRFMVEEQFGWRVAQECPKALRILDTEDLHSIRKVRQQCLKKGIVFTNNYWLQADITKREVASIYRSDLSLIISEFEMECLKEILSVDSELLHYLPFMIEELSETEISTFPEFYERQHFVTIGNLRHEPNYDSILYLKETIWPLIKAKLPEAEMHVYGSYPMEKVTQLQNEEVHFFIKGWAENVNEVMQNARVCLAPLRFGAGLKGKFIDAMKNGTPSITTSIGAEGLEAQFGGLIANSPEEIANKAIDVFTNESLWHEKQKQGYKLLERFEKSRQIEMLMSKIDTTLNSLEAFRTNNFIGSMLRHHTMQSTKYLSKWIASKSD